LILGADEHGRAISIPFAGEGGGRHMLVVGATGSGKTVTQTLLATRAIEQGMGAVVVDPKGDCDMREQLSLAASIAGRPFIEWTPGGPSVYNPYACGGETEIADKALAGERFTEPHYQRQAQRYLGHVVRALRENAIEVSLCAIVEHLDPDRLETLARTLPESHAVATHAYLDSLTTRQRSDLAGVRDRLAILTESDVGPWLDPQASAAERFDLLGATRARAVVYFNLQSDSRPLLTQILGAAIVQDLQTTVASLQARPVPTLVVIDEFSAVSAEHVVRLFGRARSAGLSLLLGTQELSDLRPPGRERLLEQVMGNLTVLIAHRQVVPASAELIASVAGSRGAWKVARHSDGRTTRTRTSEPILDPNEVRTLDPGSAAVIVLGGGGGVAIGRVLSPLQAR
jgi:type IV secretory pathway TraG/TraD family ATPase VirD4